ncbi:MAG: TIR domain-containing protein [Acidobacteriota bacterium]|nr:TIR domain-containing protein [Acidobacteriota bacterium]
MKNLQELYLDNNQLSELPKEIVELKNLKGLYLANNQLSELPKGIGELKNLQMLYLDNNPKLNIPQEIVGKLSEPQTILNYYFENIYQIKVEDKRPLKEVKVLLVGQGRVGKTSLVRYLVDDKKCNPEEPSTHGIIRNKWKVDVIEEKTKREQDVQLNMWDFGGQDIQHQTHQFFLNQRSLYLLVLDAGRDEAGNKLDYWLKKIETVGKDAPILVAVNKSEQCLLPLDYTELKTKFNIKGFFNISCETGQEIEELRQAISSEIGKIENVFEPIRKEWFAVKEHLENLEEDYISRDDYRKICREKGVTEALSQDTLLILLHELGVMLNFMEHETEVLNPEWVTRGVYQVVTSLDVQTNKGILTPELLDAEITKLNDQLHQEGKDYLRYPPEKYNFIKDLMKKFELAYQIDDTDDYFVPSLLPKDSPYVGDWNEKECLGFRYNYENGLLHETIMSRFIVRMNRYILDKTQWLTGVLIKNDNGNKALIKADLSNGYLIILIDGFQNTRREFLGIIRDKFRDIHKDNRPIEEVPLKNFPNVFISYELLLQLEKEGIEEQYTTVDGKLVKYNVKELLNSVSSLNFRKIEREPGGVEMLEKRKLEVMKNYDVALSFAGEDRDFVSGVYEELQREGISVFYDFDEEIAIDLWGEELIETLDEIYRKRSKCVVIFVSESYSKKMWTKLERRSALAKALEEKKVYVLPARFDNTELPGLLPTMAFVDLRNETPQTFAQKIIRKLVKLKSQV